MSAFGIDLIQLPDEVPAHAKDEGPAVLHPALVPRGVRKQAKRAPERMAPLVGMSLSGYREWEQGARPSAVLLLRVIRADPGAVRRGIAWRNGMLTGSMQQRSEP